MPVVTRSVPALAGVAAAALLALGGLAGPYALAAVVALVAVVLAPGWTTLLHLPSPRGSTTVIAVVGAVAAATVALTPGEPHLRWLPVVVALGVLAEFWHQLLRRDMRPRLVESVTGVVAALVVVCLGAGWVAVLRSPGGWDLVATGAAGLAAASAALLLRWPPRWAELLAVAGGAVAAALVAGWLPAVQVWPAVAAGLVIGLVVAAVARALGTLTTAHPVTAGAAWGVTPAAASGTLIYLLGRLLVG
jgi:hypothetical protein